MNHPFWFFIYMCAVLAIAAYVLFPNPSDRKPCFNCGLFFKRRRMKLVEHQGKPKLCCGGCYLVVSKDKKIGVYRQTKGTK